MTTKHFKALAPFAAQKRLNHHGSGQITENKVAVSEAVINLRRADHQHTVGTALTDKSLDTRQTKSAQAAGDLHINATPRVPSGWISIAIVG